MSDGPDRGADPDPLPTGGEGPAPRRARSFALFTPLDDGRFGVELDPEDVAALHVLFEDLRDLILDGDDEGLRRLYPTAYPDDAVLNAEYAELAHDQLLAARLNGLDLVEQSLGRDTVSEEELHAWMRAVNEIRLVIGTRLDLSEDDSRERAPDDDDAATLGLYRVLTAIVGEAVDALTTRLPEPHDDD